MYKVFIMDDEPFVRARIKELIDWEEIGFSILGEASNGEDGYRDILSLKPDLVLTDIRMPVVSGLELIRKVIPQLPHCRFIIFSGYSDFEYAHEAIKYGVKSYLLKPVGGQELSDAVLSVKEEISKERERDYILDRSFLALREKWAGDVLFRSNASDIYSRAEEMGLDVEYSFYTVIIIDWEEEDNTPEEGNEEECSVRNVLVKKAVDEVPHANGKSFIIHDGYNRYVVLFMFKQEKQSSNRPEVLACRIREKCNEFRQGHVTVGYSDIVEELSSVTGCYMRAKAAIEGKFVLGRDRSIGFQNITRNRDDENWNKISDWNRASLDEAIQSTDRIAVKKEIKKLFNVLRKLIHDPKIIRGIIAESLAGVLRILIKLDGDVSRIFEDGFSLDEWLDKHTLDELEKQFSSYCIKIMDYVAWARENRPNRTAGQIIDYIQKHYSEDISLKSISGIFYMNPAYLGQLFKKETGVLFHQYLMETRMKAAKHMLLETGLSISDIAEECGYKVIRNFYTAFRKYFKSTPNEYRNGKVTGNIRDKN